MEPTKREKLIARLKKCLALSASPEPHEAAAALRHAQKLMAELNLTEADLLGLEFTDATVKTQEGFGACRTMSHLASLIADAFGVRVFFERNPGKANRLNVCYAGPKNAVLMAEYAHRVVWRAMQGSWAEYLTQRSYLKGNRGARQSFHLGWLRNVREKIEVIIPSAEETEAVNRWLTTKFGALIPGKKAKPARVYDAIYQAGVAAAADFQLHRPVEKQQACIEYTGG